MGVGVGVGTAVGAASASRWARLSARARRGLARVCAEGRPRSATDAPDERDDQRHDDSEAINAGRGRRAGARRGWQRCPLVRFRAGWRPVPSPGHDPPGHDGCTPRPTTATLNRDGDPHLPRTWRERHGGQHGAVRRRAARTGRRRPPRSTSRSARPRTRCLPSISSCRTVRTSRSAVIRSGDAWRASRPPSRTRRTPGLVLFCYPLHPPGSPDRTDARIAHWPVHPLPGPAAVGRGRSVREDRPPAGGRAPPRARRAGHLSASRTHAEAGARRRPGPRRGLPPGAADRLMATPSSVGAVDRVWISRLPPSTTARILSVPQGAFDRPHGRRPSPRTSPLGFRRPGRRSTRSPRRPGRKELHCECCQAASRRSPSRSSRPSSSPAAMCPPATHAGAPTEPRPLHVGPRQGRVGRRLHRPQPVVGRVWQSTRSCRPSWRAWAGRYLGDPNAKPTPTNQDFVAARKLRDLHADLGSWRRTAYWWLTGSSRTSGWSSFATRYVERVMDTFTVEDRCRDRRDEEERPRRARLRPASSASPRRNCADRLHRDVEVGQPPGLRGRHRGLLDRRRRHCHLHLHREARHVVRPGRPDAWQGRVSIDGTYLRTVDLYANGFTARTAVFSKGWSKRWSAHDHDHGRRDEGSPLCRDRRVQRHALTGASSASALR